MPDNPENTFRKNNRNILRTHGCEAWRPAFRLMEYAFSPSPLPFRGHLPSCHGSVFDFHAYFTEGCRSIDDYHMIMGSFADFSDFRIFGNPFQSGFMAVQILSCSPFKGFNPFSNIYLCILSSIFLFLTSKKKKNP